MNGNVAETYDSCHFLVDDFIDHMVFVKHFKCLTAFFWYSEMHFRTQIHGEIDCLLAGPLEVQDNGILIQVIVQAAFGV